MPAIRDFHDVVAFMAQHTDRTTVARLLRVSWEAVAKISHRQEAVVRTAPSVRDRGAGE